MPTPSPRRRGPRSLGNEGAVEVSPRMLLTIAGLPLKHRRPPTRPSHHASAVQRINSRRIFSGLFCVWPVVSMDCGPNEPLCLFFDWLSRHSHTMRQSLVFRLDGLWNEAGGQVIKVLKNMAKSLSRSRVSPSAYIAGGFIASAFFISGLKNTINESDARLKPASVQTVEAILRPGRTTPSLPQPAFALELHDILARNRWLSLLSSSSVERRRREEACGRALGHIRSDNRLRGPRCNLGSEQHTQFISLQGQSTFSSTRQSGSSPGAWRDDHAALREFRKSCDFNHNHIRCKGMRGLTAVAAWEAP